MRRAAFAGLPLFAGACQLLYYLLATGSALANGVQAKSWLHAGLLRQPLEIADQTLRNAQQMIGSLSGLTGQDFAPPATLAFAVLGLVALGFRRERTLAVVLGGALAAVLLSVATLSTALWQDLRYLQPFLPLVLLPAVLGGLLIGLIETFWSAYFSVQYKDVAAFSILALTLIFLPTGLLGRQEVEKV